MSVQSWPFTCCQGDCAVRLHLSWHGNMLTLAGDMWEEQWRASAGLFVFGVGSFNDTWAKRTHGPVGLLHTFSMSDKPCAPRLVVEKLIIAVLSARTKEDYYFVIYFGPLDVIKRQYPYHGSYTDAYQKPSVWHCYGLSLHQELLTSWQTESSLAPELQGPPAPLGSSSSVKRNVPLLQTFGSPGSLLKCRNTKRIITGQWCIMYHIDRSCLIVNMRNTDNKRCHLSLLHCFYCFRALSQRKKELTNPTIIKSNVREK